MTLLNVNNVEELNSLKSSHRGLIVLHFWAAWAPQCEQMKNVIEELSKEPSNINVAFVNIEAEKLPELSQEYAINAVPTCLTMKNSTVLDRVKGTHPADLTRLVHQRSEATVITAPTTTNSTGNGVAAPSTVPLETRLKQLINKAPAMLFMKGSATTPQCGFSRQIVEILNQQGVKFMTFDILSDEEIRQGLKTYSNWPTYPQLYVNGELVGGLDIVREMAESGDLVAALPKQQTLEDRLKDLINKDKIVVFMKGSPDEPRCGFSKQTVAILKEAGSKFSHFDILSDEEVRQGLKEYSKWPTYPQLYVKGELIGGLDIIKELKESGELVSTLNA